MKDFVSHTATVERANALVVQTAQNLNTTQFLIFRYHATVGQSGEQYIHVNVVIVELDKAHMHFQSLDNLEPRPYS